MVQLTDDGGAQKFELYYENLLFCDKACAFL